MLGMLISSLGRLGGVGVVKKLLTTDTLVSFGY